MTPAIKLDKKGKLRLSEADVTRQVCDFLVAEGWRGVRMNVGGAYSSQAVTALMNNLERGAPVVALGVGVSRVRKSFVEFGEPGMPDWLFLRYWGSDRMMMNVEQTADCLWLEFKAPGKKPSAHQLDWHEAERARGALVKVVDNYEIFRDWYRATFSQ